MEKNKVFLSYANKDASYAKEIKDQLNSFGIHVWSPEQIKPGKPFSQSIMKAIEDSSAVIAIVSKNYLASSNSDMERGFALAHNKEIIPVFLDKGSELPTGLTKILGINASDINTISVSKKIANKLDKI